VLVPCVMSLRPSDIEEGDETPPGESWSDGRGLDMDGASHSRACTCESRGVARVHARTTRFLWVWWLNPAKKAVDQPRDTKHCVS